MIGPWQPRDLDGPARRVLAGEPGWVAAERLDGSAEVWDGEAGKWVQLRDRAAADRLVAALYGGADVP